MAHSRVVTTVIVTAVFGATFSAPVAWAAGTPALASAPAPASHRIRTVIWNAEGSHDTRNSFTVAVAAAALASVPGGERFALETTSAQGRMLPHARALALMSEPEGNLDIIGTAVDAQVDRALQRVNWPISMNLLGTRVLLVHCDDHDIFKTRGVTRPADLKPFTFGSGLGWPDTAIFAHAGLKVTSVARYESLFEMLRARRYQGFGRSVLEAWGEIKAQSVDDALCMDESLLVTYPLPKFFYVRREAKKLRETLEAGLEAIAKSGRLEKLQLDYFGPAIWRARLARRRVLTLANPDLPALVPKGHKDWDAFSAHSITQTLALAHSLDATWGTPVPRPLDDVAKKSSAERGHSKAGGFSVRGPGEAHQVRFWHSAALFQRMRKAGFLDGDVRVVAYNDDARRNQSDLLASLRTKVPYMDVVFSMDSEQREGAHVHTTRSITGSLLGQRVLVVRQGAKVLSELASVTTRDALRKFTICVGSDWPDRDVLAQNQVPMAHAPDADGLVALLAKGTCDAISHSVLEAQDFVLGRPLDQLTIVPNVLLTYPAKELWFIADGKKQLASKLEAGLEALEKTPWRAYLLDKYHGDGFLPLALDKRRVVALTRAGKD